MTLTGLDQVTVDLDVLVRSDLISFLVSETVNRGATIVCESVSWLCPSRHSRPLPQRHDQQRSTLTECPYRADATHIFDGLSAFPTHICHLQLGATPRPLHIYDRQTSNSEDLFKLALGWIREDRDLRRIKEKEKGRQRGPKVVGDVSVAPKHPHGDVHIRDGTRLPRLSAGVQAW